MRREEMWSELFFCARLNIVHLTSVIFLPEAEAGLIDRRIAGENEKIIQKAARQTSKKWGYHGNLG
jgi:hypothetical protein